MTTDSTWRSVNKGFRRDFWRRSQGPFICRVARTAWIWSYAIWQKRQHRPCLFWGVASSTKRWQLLKKQLPLPSAKPVCDTRWESKIDSVRAIRYQTSAVRHALVELAETTDEPKTKSEAWTGEVWVFVKFSDVAWLVFAANAVSKMLQHKHMQLDVAVKHLRGLIEFLERYRETGFASAKTDARVIAEELGITSTFKPKRVSRRKTFFDYDNAEQTDLLWGNV